MMSNQATQPNTTNTNQSTPPKPVNEAPTKQKDVINKEFSYCYVLCLIDWAGKTLTSNDYDELIKGIKTNIPNYEEKEYNKENTKKLNYLKNSEEYMSRVKGKTWNDNDDVWHIKETCFEIKDDKRIQEVEFGFYHSRIIFKIKIQTPESIEATRNLRDLIKEQVANYLKENVVSSARKLIDPEYNSDSEFYLPPIIFVYPLFKCDNLLETNEGTRPFTEGTAAFYTELDDKPACIKIQTKLALIKLWHKILPCRSSNKEKIKDGKVILRISGAQIIASTMSDWFFENLVNTIYHEGLYRQASERKSFTNRKIGAVHFGLENMLGEFAGKLIQLFQGHSNEWAQRRLQNIAIAVSLFLGSFTILEFIFNLIFR